MMTTRTQTLLIACLLFLAGCATDTLEVRDYYFPVEEFTQPVKYEYLSSEGDTTVWEMHYNDGRFSTKVYYPDGRTELTMEEISEEGSFFGYFQKTSAEGDVMVADVTKNEVLYWELEEDQEMTWSIAYTYSDATETTIKTRTLVDPETSIEFNGKTYDAIEFKDDYRILIQDVNGDTTISFTQQTIYAKGIGIYSYDRTFENGEKYEMTLVKTP